MNPKAIFNFLLLAFNLRRALLAATETCWVYVIVVFLAALMRLTASLTPLPLFTAYWLALNIGRGLPSAHWRWAILRTIAIFSAVMSVLAVARVEIYPNLAWDDWTWLARFVTNLFLSPHGISVEQIVSAAVIYVFIRGLGFGQRPLTLWFVGFQFRLGIVIFFGLFSVAAFFPGVIDDLFFAQWIFVYFFLSLLAGALARIEETSTDFRFTVRWVMTLLASVALVLFLGLGVLQIFTVDTAQRMLGIFAPLWGLFSIVLLIIAIPIGYLLEWLVNLLRPLFQSLGQVLENLQNSPLGNLLKSSPVQQNAANNELLATLMKTTFILAILLLIGYWLARALNKKMQGIEQETFIRESISDDDAAERALHTSTKKKKQPRAYAPNIAAETIRRIYAALVARAAAAGLPRRVAETPYEFLPRLENHWSDESADLRSITEAYVDAHYAEHETTQEQVGRVREAWRRVEESIKRKA